MGIAWLIIKLILLALLILLSLPFIILWIACKYSIFKFIFLRNLKKCGVPKEAALELIQKIRVTELINIVKHRK